MRITITLLFTTLLSFAVKAQDLIIKTSGDSIACNIIEVQDQVVRYTLRSNASLNFSTNKRYISRIEMANGETYEFESNNAFGFTEGVSYALKTPFIGALIGVFELGTEISVSTRQSIEFSFGYIYDDNIDAEGVSLRAGYRFYKREAVENIRYNGFYLKPEFIFTSITYNGSQEIDSEGSTAIFSDFNSRSYTMMLNFGYQFITEGKFLVDVYGGLGLGKIVNDTEITNFKFERKRYATYQGIETSPFAATAGIRLGWIIQ